MNVGKNIRKIDILCNALKGKRNMCGGYRWKYDDESEVAVND